MELHVHLKGQYLLIVFINDILANYVSGEGVGQVRGGHNKAKCAKAKEVIV